MKSLLIGIIAFVSAASFGQVAGSAANWEVFTSWDFADTNLLSAPQGQHIGNPASGYITDWSSLVQDGLTMPGSDGQPANTGALRIGKTALAT